MSRLPFELLLALRYLRPKRTFVSIITLISVIGVMLGVAVLIIVISVMSGFDRQLREKLLGFNAHLRVIQPGELLAHREEAMARVMANPRVKGVAPFVQGKVMLETQPPVGSSVVDAPVVRGVDPQWLRSLYGFAIAPHLVFYLKIDVDTLIGRILESRGMDFWESGMDLKHGDDIYDSFRAYQQKLLREYASMADEFHFRVLAARRSVDRIQDELRKQVENFLEPSEKPAEPALAR